MSSWRPKQGPARFRGVAFFVEAGEQAGGRQTVAHEFPFSESAAFTEDLGLKGRTFQVEGYVLGAEYETARDNLLRALETEGPGELVHPYLGTRRVAVVSYRVRQTRDEGGVAKFSIEFRESSAELNTATSTPDAVSVAEERVAAARETTLAEFAATRREVPAADGLSNLPAAELAAVFSAVQGMERVILTVPIAPELRAAFYRALQVDLEAVTQGEWIAGYIGAGFAALRSAVEGLARPSRLLLRLFDLDLGAAPLASTSERAAELADWAATVALVRRLALVNAADLLLGEGFASYEDAVAAREAVTDRIDEHLEVVTDGAFATFLDLRGSLVAAVPGEAADLPRIQTYELAATTPSLVLAHRLYGHLDREADLVARNGVRHPGFVAPGTIKVLTDA